MFFKKVILLNVTQNMSKKQKKCKLFPVKKLKFQVDFFFTSGKLFSCCKIILTNSNLKEILMYLKLNLSKKYKIYQT